MPAKNAIKEYVEDGYYHVYNRGVSKSRIFHDTQDYQKFLELLERYLSHEAAKKPNGVKYVSYADDVSLLAYCLMPNHFHLLLQQKSKNGMANLMKSVCVAYSMYFNKKYGHVGTVLQQRYRAVRMTNDAQFTHISRYIHMNPKDYEAWRWSSLGYYTGEKRLAWVYTDRLPEVGDYRAFLNEYRDRRDELAALKDIFAG
ncbi:MAG: transposase [Candidatus Saccharimonadales bacterium]|jgi:putative transposase